MKKYIFILIINFFNSSIYAQSNAKTSKKLSEEIEKLNSRGYLAGFSVAIVNQDGTLYEKGFGHADIKTKKKYTSHTIQNIASISKTFIGIALLKSQELGKLNLDDPINKYLPFDVSNPYFPNESITIRQLATHTSSIKDPQSYEKKGYILKEKKSKEAIAKRNFRLPNEKIVLDEFLKNILSKDGKWYRKKNFLKKEPGEVFEYSNVGAGLAALVIEKATSQSFNDFTKKYILEPLNMEETGWSFNEIDFSNHSKLYLNNKTELAFYQLANYPDGGLITSSADLGKYLSELIAGYCGNGHVLTKASYAEFFKPQLTESNFTQRNESVYNDEYNVGIFMGISAQRQIGHTGGDPCVATHMFFNTETKTGKLLMVNTELKEEGILEFIDIWRKLEEYESKL